MNHKHAIVILKVFLPNMFNQYPEIDQIKIVNLDNIVKTIRDPDLELIKSELETKILSHALSWICSYDIAIIVL